MVPNHWRRALRLTWTVDRSLRERGPELSQRPAFIELLFDVAFVLALSQLSAMLFRDPTWASVSRALVLVVAFWWVWAFTTAVTNRLDPRKPSAQAAMIVIMLGVSVMGAAVIGVFDGAGLTFAAIYVVIQFGRTLFVAVALRGRAVARGSMSLLLWFTLTGAFWIGGGLGQDDARTILWAAAVILTYLMARFDFWLPWLQTARVGELKVSAEHVAERYQQIIVVALGDKILAAGLTFGDYEFNLARTVAFVVSFATTILLWRIYFFTAGSLMADTIAASHSRRGRLSEAISYAHLVMFAGILFSATGEKIIVAYPSGSADLVSVAIIVGGPALFLIGRERLDYLTFKRISRSRLVGLLILAAAVPFMVSLPPPWITAAVNTVLFGIVLSDSITERAHPHTPTPSST